MTTQDALRRVERALARLARSDATIKRRNARSALAKAIRLLRRKVDEEYPKIAPPKREVARWPRSNLTPSQRESIRAHNYRKRTARLDREGWAPIPVEHKWEVMTSCLAARVEVKFVRKPGDKQAWPWARKWVLAVPADDIALMRECKGNTTKQRAVLAADLLGPTK